MIAEGLSLRNKQNSRQSAALFWGRHMSGRRGLKSRRPFKILRDIAKKRRILLAKGQSADIFLA